MIWLSSLQCNECMRRRKDNEPESNRRHSAMLSSLNLTLIKTFRCEVCATHNCISNLEPCHGNTQPLHPSMLRTYSGDFGERTWHLLDGSILANWFNHCSGFIYTYFYRTEKIKLWKNLIKKKNYFWTNKSHFCPSILLSSVCHQLWRIGSPSTRISAISSVVSQSLIKI